MSISLSYSDLIDTPPLLNKDLIAIMEEVHHKYFAILLDSDSQRKLKSLFKSYFPENWAVKCHHMTINPFKECTDVKIIGTQINLMVVSFGIDDKACAVKVTGYKGKTNNKFAHVTIAVNETEGGAAKDSNNIKIWNPVMEHILLTGTLENL